MINDPLYQDLKPHMQSMADALFTVSENLLKKHGNFIPNGAVMAEDGSVKHVVVAPKTDNDLVTSATVLPLLHENLREEASKPNVVATGVAENVTIKREGHRPSEAIKVLFEHRAGLTVALYLPFRKKLLGGYTFEAVFSRSAQPEVKAFV